jgi:putative oxidoreductase
MEIAILLGRILFGGYFVVSGLNHFTQKKGLSGYATSKNIPSPEMAVALSGAILFVSGVCIVFGWFVNIALIALAGFLFIVSFTMHNFWKIKDPQARMGDQINFMKNLALLGACLIMLGMTDSWTALL